MTYALTKSYLLCGLAEDDHRLVAATRWLADHWALDRNPGFDDPDKDGQGLYYYYMAMARTLARLPDGSFKSRDKQPIEWRHELIRHLIDEQRTTGSWINDRATRWWEGSPGLCTPYAVLALKAAEA
jgi:squalene-hopene/tetraprenyl-beta-curcumene cyclase